MNIFKISNLVSVFDRSIFDIPYEKQKNFLDQLGDANNDIERSYKQYKCQCLFIPLWKQWLFNAITSILYPFVLIVLLCKSYAIKQKERLDAIGEMKYMGEIIPEELDKEFDINHDYFNRDFFLKWTDIKFIISLLEAYPFSPYFQLKLLLKLSFYSYMIHCYRPRAIVVHGEYSFTSSVLTGFCQYNHVAHINVMHGEKLFYIRDSYFRFHRCYVWDEFYKNLFLSLKAEASQFIIAIPPSLRINQKPDPRADSFADYKYYLANYSEEEIKSIVRSMDFVSKKGQKVVFRPHPRYSDVQLLRKVVSENCIEYPSKVNIIDSIANCDHVVGSFSTVLLQGYCTGKDVILDDVTYWKQYELLREYKYHLIHEVSIHKLSQYPI